MRLSVATHIQWAYVNGTVYLLDLESGRYIGLGPRPTDFWRRNVDRLAEGRLGSHVNSGLSIEDMEIEEALLEKGYICIERLCAAPRPVPATEPTRLPFLLSAIRELFALRLIIRFRGFRAAYLYAMRAARTRSLIGGEYLQSAIRAFQFADNLNLVADFRRDCLPRSLALFCHMIGIAAPPFAAHAWVDYAGEPLLDSIESCGRFSPISIIE